MLAECQFDKVIVSPSRASVERLESYLIQYPQVEIKTEHKFAQGLYIRQITIPAGTLLTGCACNSEHLSVMVSGAMHVLADGALRELRGYHQWIAPAGVKRVGIAIDDTIWFTVHPNPTDERCVETLENALYDTPENIQSRRIADGRVTVTKEAACLS